ncbi:unnamed protein product [Didymodactylos carnosus]|uniref:Uncharacterized protein n=1 Tax=Didymodactylos carnosus TaxID=1234261 RepID=A0A8S2R1U8_9BILA|nr:unnamed protein product [Didymodactylos carnosus]CAF4139545.1 unnamed protein product [Didymodactylos carnosus]
MLWIISHKLISVQINGAMTLRRITDNFVNHTERELRQNRSVLGDYKDVLKSLSNVKSVVICKPDKGRAVVILDRSEYIEKMSDIVNPSILTCHSHVQYDKETVKITTFSYLEHWPFGALEHNDPNIELRIEKKVTKYFHYVFKFSVWVKNDPLGITRVNDTSVFKRITIEPTISKEDKFTRLLLQLRKAWLYK